mmetsp:Transcript_14432/g.25392  ORF Transcript_14432/g.25392 Transcript_14432/m.25392 type:complete len:309 (-) Transcript_14432:14-940(-)
MWRNVPPSFGGNGSRYKHQELLTRSAHLGLVLDGLSSRLDLLSISKVTSKLQGLHGEITRKWLQISVQLVDQRSASWDLKARDDVVGDALDHLHDGADGIAVCGHEDCLSSLQLWSNLLLPVGHDTSNGVLQALGVRNVLWVQILVFGLLAWVVLVVLLQRWWRDIKAAAPDLHLISAMLHNSLLFVQTSEAAVHTLVQAPGLVHGHKELFGALECDVAGLDGTLQIRSVADIELQSFSLQQLAGSLGLSKAFLREVDIDPASEDVGNIPLRLAVAREDQSGVRCHPRQTVSAGTRALDLLIGLCQNC